MLNACVDQSRRALVVDDDPAMQAALQETLSRNGFEVSTASDGNEGVERCMQESFGIVIADVRMPRVGGIEMLRAIKRKTPGTVVIMMTAYGTIEMAVEAMRFGAADYLVKPFSAEAIEAVLTRVNGGGSIRPSLGDHRRQIVTEDASFHALLQMMEGVAASQATVLIQGESGTGKELLARFIHERSPRAHRPFVAVNCAALPDGLLESELFGYERGAFTGALTRKLGKFELADSGTILLDEIGEMSLLLQAKLLRVMQEREVDRVGGQKPVPVDIRIIATTNRQLRKEMDAGRFREDLFYRLNVFPVTVPPLRDRRGDIPTLITHFLGVVCARAGIPVSGVSEEVLNALVAYDWPGNIRELEHATERAILLAQGGELRTEFFLPEQGGTETHVLTRSAGDVSLPNATPSSPPKPLLWEAERSIITSALNEVNGNRTQAAKILGIALRTLRNKLREYRETDAVCPTGT